MSTQLLLFGGNISSTLFGDSWRLNTSIPDYFLLSPATSPSARLANQMVYNPDLNLTMFFGGLSSGGVQNDTWIWDGSNWNSIATTGTPPARFVASMVYDTVRKVSVLFGGRDTSTFFNDTWTYDWVTATWTQKFPGSSPSGRFGAGMAFDIVNGLAILYGGEINNSPLTFNHETWSWDGTNWTIRSPVSFPSDRGFMGFAYDITSSQLLLYAGLNSTFSDLQDTWVYDPPLDVWSNLSFTNPPQNRYEFPMSYDYLSGNLILFGGTSAITSAFFNDTWAWNGSSWSLVSPATSPSARVNAVLAPAPFAIVCTGKDTEIKMANGFVKQIKDISRDDLLEGNFRVARILVQKINGNRKINVVKINKDALGLDQPNKTLFVTENHPIVYQNARRPAFCFEDINGVEYQKNVRAGDIFSVEPDGSVELYDIQYEIEGTYNANGLLLQSRSPKSLLTPLPMELYFNRSLYTDERVYDTYDHEIVYDERLL